MKINCFHGYYLFEEKAAGQISDFASLTGFNLVSDETGIFTFDTLANAPRYAIAGGLYLGAPVIKTFEGLPWEIMRENKLVYNFNLDKVVPIISVLSIAQISTGRNYYLSNGMILAGSITDDGSRVTDYAAHYIFDQMKFKYSEVDFE